jgi:hypothetical protein
MTKPGSLPDHHGLTSPNPNAHAGEIAAIGDFALDTLEHALELGHLTIPAGIAKDRIGLGDGKPALDIIEPPALDLTGVNAVSLQRIEQRFFL